MKKIPTQPFYILERHRDYWRLRREGNREGTSRHFDPNVLRSLAIERGWVVREVEL